MAPRPRSDFPSPHRRTRTRLRAARARVLAAERASAAYSARLQTLQRDFVERDRLAAVSALFASIAHDIRSPLTALVCNQRMLEERLAASPFADDPTIQAVLADNRLACELIEGVLQSMRSYVAGGGAPKPVPVRAILEATVRLFRWYMANRAVRIEHHVQGEPTALGTPAELCQMVLNMLANAADASPRGGTIRAIAFERGEHAIIRVTDEGPGLDPRDADRVFEPFHAREGAGGGLGIGLWIARTMARHHGGDIVICDRGAGARGACLEVQLVAVPNAVHATAQPASR